MAKSESRWGRFWARLMGSGEERELVLPEAEPEATDEAVEQGFASSDEQWLDELVGDASEGQRVEEIAGSEFWSRIDALSSQGEELLAAQWVEKFLHLDDISEAMTNELRANLVERFEARGNLSPVLSELEALCEIEEYALRAHYLLAEHHRRRGDELLALRAYEAVLARDVDYPNVRSRVERLRAARGKSSHGSAAETMAGASPIAGEGGSRYLLVRELGRGASGVVYLARDTQLEREVAVKLLHPHVAAATQRGALQRFFAEARVAASLRHPNIVAILDLDEKARRIVMELCAGGTLRAVLRDRGARPLREALQRHAQVLSALDAAHARGIVHRDLKPANLMFRRDPDLPGAEVVLGDFGVAHLPDARGKTGGARAKVAEAGPSDRRQDAVGTLAYMAPEQRRGEVSSASDLYASAVVLFEMITARYPWSRKQLLEGKRSEGDFTLPEAITEAQRELGQELQVHLDRLGDPDPAKRPDTTTAMKEARRLRDAATVLCRDGDPTLGAA